MADTVTGQLADTPTRGLPTRGLDDSRSGHLADWSTRTGQVADAIGDSTCLTQLNSTSCNGCRCEHLFVRISMTLIYIYVSDITFTDLSPVPVRSAVKSNFTSWPIQNLSKRALNTLTELTSTTWLGKLCSLCLVFLFGGICETASCPVRDLSSPQVDQSARCPVRELAIRELAYPRVVQLPPMRRQHADAPPCLHQHRL